jgi:transcriptional regulator with XRE-family HTH domain
LTDCVSGDTVLDVGRQAESEPGDFAKAVSREFRREAGDRRLSGRKLATAIGKSEKYVRERLADVLSFTLNDIEAFATFLEMSPEEFVARIERDMAPTADIVHLDSRRNVVDPAEDDLDAVARATDPDRGEDQ